MAFRRRRYSRVRRVVSRRRRGYAGRRRSVRPMRIGFRM